MEVITSIHQSQLPPQENKFHVGNGDDGKHYWLTPPALLAQLSAEFNFDFDPCPYPKPDDFDGLTQPWGQSSYVNPPFGSIIHEGKKKGPTAWARKSISEAQQGKDVVLVYPIDKWVLMLIVAGAEIRNLGDVRWMATEDGSQGKGTGRHIAAFILRGSNPPAADMLTTLAAENATLRAERDEAQSELDDYHASDWPIWAKQIYNTLKEFGYRYDHFDGIDLPEDVSEFLRGFPENAASELMEQRDDALQELATLRASEAAAMERITVLTEYERKVVQMKEDFPNGI